MLINEQPTQTLTANPTHGLASVSVNDLISLMRVDKTFGQERIANAILDAYDVVNAQIYVLNGTTLLPITAFHAHINSPLFVRTYRRAVMAEAAALLADLYTDFDTIGQGYTRGANSEIKSDKLRRIVSHAVADLNGKKRNRIRLL